MANLAASLTKNHPSFFRKFELEFKIPRRVAVKVCSNCDGNGLLFIILVSSIVYLTN